MQLIASHNIGKNCNFDRLISNYISWYKYWSHNGQIDSLIAIVLQPNWKISKKQILTVKYICMN